MLILVKEEKEEEKDKELYRLPRDFAQKRSRSSIRNMKRSRSRRRRRSAESRSRSRSRSGRCNTRQEIIFKEEKGKSSSRLKQEEVK
jgi:hypothetical protein